MRLSPAHLSRGLRASAFALIVLLCTPATAWAEEFKKDRTPLTGLSETDGSGTSGGGGGLGRLLLGLLIVAGLVLALTWLLKRANRTRTPQAAGALEVVATTPLAQGRSVHLLRVGDELVLVGSAEHGVTPIRVYGPAEARALEASMGVASFVETGVAPGTAGLLGDLRRRTAR